ncbi:MAG: hypothetical protein L3J25_09990, partial [Flavobacteriaceae bacterium]|nr:hypothetical protein [Flavobacteriaceae bacterium]
YDPLGLYAKVTVGKPRLTNVGKGNGYFGSSYRIVTPVEIAVTVMFKNESGLRDGVASSAAKNFEKGIEDKWSGTFGKYEVKTEVTVLKTDEKAKP